MDLKNKNENTCKASFLNLPKEVLDRKCITKLFDKTDTFPFYINYMAHLDSNIPSKIFYASVGSEI